MDYEALNRGAARATCFLTKAAWLGTWDRVGCRGYPEWCSATACFARFVQGCFGRSETKQRRKKGQGTWIEHEKPKEVARLREQVTIRQGPLESAAPCYPRAGNPDAPHPIQPGRFQSQELEWVFCAREGSSPLPAHPAALHATESLRQRLGIAAHDAASAASCTKMTSLTRIAIVFAPSADGSTAATHRQGETYDCYDRSGRNA